MMSLTLLVDIALVNRHNEFVPSIQNSEDEIMRLRMKERQQMLFHFHGRLLDCYLPYIPLNVMSLHHDFSRVWIKGLPYF